jgi:hypothetical protein
MNIPPYIYNETSSHYLAQGDIIKVEGEFGELFSKFYPAIKHAYVMVLNQSCDLVKHQSRSPKIEHISVCLIRSFSEYLSRYIESLKPFLFTDKIILDKETYRRLEDKIRKLLNNSSEDKKIFYLPKTPPFSEDMIALLSLSYSFKIKHYDILLENRVLKLKNPFPAKVGDMLANYYGRVATPDLSEEGFSDKNVKSHIEFVMKKLGLFQVPDLRYIDYLECFTKEEKDNTQNISLEDLITQCQITIRQENFKSERAILMKKFREKLFKIFSNEESCKQFTSETDNNILRKNISLLLKDL